MAAERTGISRQSISRKLEVLPEKFPGTGWAKLSTFSEDDWKPPIYNVWTFAAKSNAVEHFGNTEERIVDNLLYLYTEPYDIVWRCGWRDTPQVVAIPAITLIIAGIKHAAQTFAYESVRLKVWCSVAVVAFSNVSNCW